jgi:hypothetical protein
MQTKKSKKCYKCGKRYPLNDKHWYKSPLAKDGFSKQCKECYKKNVTEHRRKKAKEEKKNKPIEKSKVPNTPKPYITTRQQLKWQRNIFLRCVIQCMNCGEVMEIHERHFAVNCKKCNKNLIIHNTINFLWARVLFANWRMRKFNVYAFNPWRDRKEKDKVD